MIVCVVCFWLSWKQSPNRKPRINCESDLSGSGGREGGRVHGKEGEREGGREGEKEGRRKVKWGE